MYDNMLTAAAQELGLKNLEQHNYYSQQYRTFGGASSDHSETATSVNQAGHWYIENYILCNYTPQNYGFRFPRNYTYIYFDAVNKSNVLESRYTAVNFPLPSLTTSQYSKMLFANDNSNSWWIRGDYLTGNGTDFIYSDDNGNFSVPIIPNLKTYENEIQICDRGAEPINLNISSNLTINRTEFAYLGDEFRYLSNPGNFRMEAFNYDLSNALCFNDSGDFCTETVYPIIDSDAILYFDFNNESIFRENYTSEEGENVIIDYSKYSNNGLSKNNISYNEIGGFLEEGAFDFDGTNDYILIPGSSSLNINSKATISFWIKPFNIESGCCDYIYDDRSGNGLAIQVESSLLKIVNCVGECTSGASTTNLTANEWQHYIFVYDTTNATNGSRIYRNGIPIANGPTKALQSSTGNKYLGSQTGTQRYLNGSLDEFILWNKTFYDNDALQMYNRYLGNNISVFSQNLANNDGVINISIPAGKNFTILNEYNITRSINRANDPLWNSTLNLINNTLNTAITVSTYGWTNAFMYFSNGSVRQGGDQNITIQAGDLVYIEDNWQGVINTTLNRVYKDPIVFNGNMTITGTGQSIFQNDLIFNGTNQFIIQYSGTKFVLDNGAKIR